MDKPLTPQQVELQRMQSEREAIELKQAFDIHFSVSGPKIGRTLYLKTPHR
jgi:hypothetical protein